MVNQKRWLDFRISDEDGNPVAGRHLTDFTQVFTRNNMACADTLILTDCTGGRYILSYTPSDLGHDYIELYDTALGTRPLMDAEDIVDASTGGGGGETPSDIVTLTEDYGGAGRLKPTLANPSTLVLYLFRSYDWQAGRRSENDSLYWTAIDESGHWVTAQITVLPDTYHVVARDSAGREQIVAAFLAVGA